MFIESPIKNIFFNKFPSLALWIYDFKSSIKPISKKERLIYKNLPPRRASQFKYSRGYIRYSLAYLFDMDPLKIPIEALPGKPPLLPNDWGFLSISHSKDALLVGWSPYKLGIDIENTNRNFCYKLLAKKYFSLKENLYLENLNDAEFKKEVLKMWVKKEAAIKWQNGKLLKDISLWECLPKNKKSNHLEIGKEVNLYSLYFKNWNISVASEYKYNQSLVLCRT